MMRVAIWITRLEIVRRKGPVSVAIGAMAAAIAICVATDYVAHSREIAVVAEIDLMGPSILVLPPGRSSRDMVRFSLGKTMLPLGLPDRLQRELGGRVRASDGRLLLKLPVAGIATSVAGVSPAEIVSHLQELRGIRGREVVIGADLSARLECVRGDHIDIAGRDFVVNGVLPRSTIEETDILYMSLQELQLVADLPDAVNAILVYTMPGVRSLEIQRDLSARLPDLTVLAVSNDDGAREAIETELSAHRLALYLITGALALVFILVWSFQDAEDRQSELATLIAIGGSARMILLMFGMRAILLGLAAAIVGVLVGTGLGIVNGNPIEGRAFLSVERLVVWSAFAATISLVGSLPAAVMAARRDHIVDLSA